MGLIPDPSVGNRDPPARDAGGWRQRPAVPRSRPQHHARRAVYGPYRGQAGAAYSARKIALGGQGGT